VTDADLSAGLIDPNYFLGGRFRLSPASAHDALARNVATPLAISADEAALLVRQQADQQVGRAIESLVRGRGWKPEELVLLAYGGAGPLHAVGMAAAAGIGTVMVFPFGSVFSAFGMSHMDVNHVYTRTRPFVLFNPHAGTYGSDLESFNSTVHEMVERALIDMRGEGIHGTDDITFELDVLVREEGGASKAMVRSPRLTLKSTADVQAICERFRAQVPSHNDRARTILETFILKATAATGDKSLPEYSENTTVSSSARKSGRPVLWSKAVGFRETVVYDLARLQPGNRIDGPAIVEAEDTVCPVPAGATFSLDRHRTGVVTLISR
jgi:N-methylhydantoinase A/acetophenone carboxylase